jgi:hypothetical protein
MVCGLAPPFDGAVRAACTFNIRRKKIRPIADLKDTKVCNLDTSRRWLSSRAGRVLAGCGRGGLRHGASRFSSPYASLRRTFFGTCCRTISGNASLCATCEIPGRGSFSRPRPGISPSPSSSRSQLGVFHRTHWSIAHTPLFGSSANPAVRPAASLNQLLVTGSGRAELQRAVQMPIASSRACPPCPVLLALNTPRASRYGRFQTN